MNFLAGRRRKRDDGRAVPLLLHARGLRQQPRQTRVRPSQRPSPQHHQNQNVEGHVQIGKQLKKFQILLT